MYIDKELLLSDEQPLGDTGTTVCDFSINLGAARRVWQGKQLYVVVIIDETIAGTSVNFQVITDSVEGLNDTPTVQIQTGEIPTASLTANRAPIVIPIGSAIGTAEQYLGIQYVIVGTTTTGKVTAFIAFDAPTEQ